MLDFLKNKNELSETQVQAEVKARIDSEQIRMRSFALKNGVFNSKKSAFDYYYIFEGKSVEEADRLATAITAARGVPEITETPASTLDKIKGWIKQGNDLYSEYPKIGDFIFGLISGAVTSLGGVAVGSSIAENKAVEQRYEFNNDVPKEIENEVNAV